MTDVLRAAGEADAENERPARSANEKAGALTAVAGSPDGRVWTAFKHGRLELYTAAGRLVWRKVGACQTMSSRSRCGAGVLRVHATPIVLFGPHWSLPAATGGLHNGGMCSVSSVCQRVDRCVGSAAVVRNVSHARQELLAARQRRTG